MCGECIRGKPLPGEKTKEIFAQASIPVRGQTLRGLSFESLIAMEGSRLPTGADVYIAITAQSSGTKKARR